MTDAELQALTRGLRQPLADFVARELAPLRARIEELERRPSVKYAGIHQPGEKYTAGALVTRSGGLWLALTETSATPGADHTSWRLVVKAGAA